MISEDVLNSILSGLDDRLASAAWPTLSNFAQWMPLAENVRDRMAHQVRAAALSEDAEERLRGFDGLSFVGVTAAAHRDRNLADAIGSRCVAEALNVRSGAEAGYLVQALLLAAAAFENEAEWSTWLEAKLTDLASRLPVGEPSATLLSCIQGLKRCLPLALGIHCRPEALASLAGGGERR